MRAARQFEWARKQAFGNPIYIYRLRVGKNYSFLPFFVFFFAAPSDCWSVISGKGNVPPVNFDVCFLADGAFDFEFCAIFPESARAHSAAYSFMEALAAFVSADFLELAEAFA